MDRENLIEEEDEVEMKLTKFGFRLNLLRFSSVLSLFGIVTSLLMIILGFAVIVMINSGSTFVSVNGQIIIIVMGLVIFLNIPYLVIWIVIKIKTSKRHISGVERIVKIYCYAIGFIETKAMIGIMIIGVSSFHNIDDVGIILIVGAAVNLIAVCMKFYGIRLEKSKWIGIYIGFRYALFLLSLILLSYNYSVSVLLLTGITVYLLYFMLDLGLTIILHSIRVDRENHLKQLPYFFQ